MLTHFSASGKLTPVISFTENEKVLGCDGTVLATILGVSPVMETADLHMHSRSIHALRNPIGFLWLRWLHISSFNLDLKGNSESTLLMEYACTFTQGYKQAKNRTEQTQNDQYMRCMQDFAAYITSAFGNSMFINPDVQSLADQGDAESWARQAVATSNQRRLAITKDNSLVLVPYVAKPDDKIVILFGGTTPFVVRQEDDHYLLMGECYMHGFMSGEAIDMLEAGKLESQTFRIH
jgi:hypothetical protein